MLQKFKVNLLCPGMFVTRIAEQKGKIKISSRGLIRTVQDITALLDKGILQVEIDLSKSTHQQNPTYKSAADDEYVNDSGLTYGEQITLTFELYAQAKVIHSKIISNLRSGKPYDIDDVTAISGKIVDIAFKCNDAASIVTLIKDQSAYLLEHGINCTILMTIFARHQGIDRNTCYQLGIGTLLMDIGMAKMPLLLIEKPGELSEKETAKIQTHVDLALTMLEHIDSITELSLQVIAQHHERLDGSGYPKGLASEQISQYGRMAAIVDVYDSLTAKRPNRAALSPALALIKINKQVLGLDQTLVNSFIQCIGAFPIGSVVKLQSEQLAIVMRLNKQAPLKPVVMVFYDLQKNSDCEPRQVDLAKTEDTILSSISPEDFDIELVVFLQKIFTAL